MRTIKVPVSLVERAAYGPVEGYCLEFAVQVDWPELQLTEEQMLANTIAQLDGHVAPYPNHSVFSVRVPYLTPLRGAYNGS